MAGRPIGKTNICIGLKCRLSVSFASVYGTCSKPGCEKYVQENPSDLTNEFIGAIKRDGIKSVKAKNLRIEIMKDRKGGEELGRLEDEHRVLELATAAQRKRVFELEAKANDPEVGSSLGSV